MKTFTVSYTSLDKSLNKIVKTALVQATDRTAAVSQCKIQSICHFSQIIEIA